MTDLPLLISTLEEGDHMLVELRVETRAEVWRDVPGLPFKASNFGRIIGKRGVVLGGSLCRDGYRWTVAEIDRKRAREILALPRSRKHGDPNSPKRPSPRLPKYSTPSNQGETHDA
jgi:hypothetical protein